MKGEKRKQELLRIAYQMFIQKGYEATSIDEIIAEAHIAKGTYYSYFPSKEAALKEVINMMINDEVERAKEAFLPRFPFLKSWSVLSHCFDRNRGKPIFPTP